MVSVQHVPVVPEPAPAHGIGHNGGPVLVDDDLKYNEIPPFLRRNGTDDHAARARDPR
jgi:hypothetical protein